jgi:hypothetical protein
MTGAAFELEVLEGATEEDDEAAEDEAAADEDEDEDEAVFPPQEASIPIDAATIANLIKRFLVIS